MWFLAVMLVWKLESHQWLLQVEVGNSLSHFFWFIQIPKLLFFKYTDSVLVSFVNLTASSPAPLIVVQIFRLNQIKLVFLQVKSSRLSAVSCGSP